MSLPFSMTLTEIKKLSVPIEKKDSDRVYFLRIGERLTLSDGTEVTCCHRRGELTYSVSTRWLKAGAMSRQKLLRDFPGVAKAIGVR